MTQASVKAALRKPGRYRDGEGLMLFVREGGSASWVVRLQKDGKRRDYGIGSQRLVGLAEAREKAREIKKALMEGRDPHALSRPADGMTSLFRETAIEFLETKMSEASKSRALARMKTHAFPKLGKLQLQSVDADVIAECLKPIWTSKPETGRKVRQLIIRTLRYGRPDGALLESTLAKAVTDRLPPQPRRGNHAAMPYQNLPTFIGKLAQKGGMGALALRGVILTAARSGEIRGALWSEVDLENGIWTIPAERMKMKRPHRVPLSDPALEIFSELRLMRRSEDGFVFPSRTGKALSDMTLTKAMRDLDEPFTVHGMRSSFRDWAAEQTSVPGEVAEAALAHAVPDVVEAAYKRTTFFDKRRELMDAWAGYLMGSSDEKVVSLASNR